MRKDKYREYLNSEAWAIRRKWKLEQAGYRCQVCNSGGEVHVHHRTYERVGHEQEGDLTVLCKGCHARFHDVLPQPPAPRPATTPDSTHRARRFVDWWYRNKDSQGWDDWETWFPHWANPSAHDPQDYMALYEEARAEIARREASS